MFVDGVAGLYGFQKDGFMWLTGSASCSRASGYALGHEHEGVSEN